ncbi:MAG: modification methylase, partial [Prevotella sp.]|nr:modification methylase [Prevotella sp.]
MVTRNLDKAKEAKKDEFYTQLVDIENELKHYRQHFRGKTILCNCDDPYESNFFKYFANNFNAFGLKKLIATCYNGSPVQGSELMIDFGDFQEEPK